VKLIGAGPGRPIRLAHHLGGVCLTPEAVDLRTAVPREYEIFLTDWFELYEDNHGRRAAVLDPDADSHRDRQRLEPVGDSEESAAREFMQAGGWSVWTLGRPPRGIRGPDLIQQRIEQLASGFDYATATREERADLVARLLADTRPVNRQALADHWGVNRSTITRLYTLGKQLHQNSAKGGRAVSSA
jgi:hypothetical protein